jgi:hypothetical protein
VANSIGRVALAGGLFSGKSKQLYDYLYTRTRGAFIPCMTARISNKDLMQGADISSEITLRANVARLCEIGLVEMVRRVGTHEGNEYTVFVPEEVQGGASGTSTTRGTDTSKNLPPLVGLESSTSSTSVNGDESITSGESKTSFKTNTEQSDDDEAFAGLLAQLKEAARDITGREVSPAEAARWRELGELLVTELKIAAGRTIVSNVPAFLTEHLRRRLWKKEKRQIEAEAADHKRPVTSVKVDASKCPDCFGTGMYYPKGFDKGVARCPHEKLTEAQG